MKAGTYIKETRLRKGLTQDELALKTNINSRTIQRIESGEVSPRAHSLRTIAQVLEINLSEFYTPENNDDSSNKSMLVFLHLSGLLLLPAIMIWFFEKDKSPVIKEHGTDVINFQLTMLVVVIPCLIIPFLAILAAIFTTMVILYNTYKVITNQPYHYPLTISFLKHGTSDWGNVKA